MNVRLPAVAGRFYPASAHQLATDVATYLTEARPASHDDVPRAIVGPHAGYVFSGPIAGSAYAMLAPLGDSLRRAIVIGPSHHVAFEGIATSAASWFRTPLGDCAVDIDAIRAAKRHAFVGELEVAHEREHSLETHLPFLQTINPAVQIVPLVTGFVANDDLATLLDELWDDGTVLCVSSDLSHFDDYDTASRHDADTSRRIASFDATIGPRDACGAVAIDGMLAVARDRGLASEIVDVRNSGDTAGSKDSVVGYGAYGFWS